MKRKLLLISNNNYYHFQRIRHERAQQHTDDKATQGYPRGIEQDCPNSWEPSRRNKRSSTKERFFQRT